MFGIPLAIVLSACAKHDAQPNAAAPLLQPMDFFAGRTHGEGELAKLFSRPIKVTVDGVGHREGDTLILDQTIHEGQAPPHLRRWTMKSIAANRFSGSLTDAVGQVDVIVKGPHADIRYTTKAGYEVRQRLELQSDGKTILNQLRVHKFGVRVATLSETIRKLN